MACYPRPRPAARGRLSEEPEPVGSLAVLGLHDAVEWFLSLACEVTGDADPRDKPTFTSYLGALKRSRIGRLSQDAAMRRLNTARVGLKHSGIRPQGETVEHLRARTSVFFEDNCPRIFGVEFVSVSLIDVVTPTSVRLSLQRAQEAYDAGDVKTAFENLAIGFWGLVDDFEGRFMGVEGAPFRSGERYFGELLGLSVVPDDALGIASFKRKAISSIGYLERTVRILGMGLDYRAYVRFSRCTPDAWDDHNGIRAVWDPEMTPPTRADFRPSLNFVIDSALKLAEVDSPDPSG